MTATSRARVIKSGSRITVRFDNGWNDPGRELIIVLGDVKAPNYRGNYEFTTRTRGSANGTLKGLPDAGEPPATRQPKVTVGNIGAADSGAVEITPGTVYEGQEDVQFRITFTAKGPIYDEGDTTADDDWQYW